MLRCGVGKEEEGLGLIPALLRAFKQGKNEHAVELQDVWGYLPWKSRLACCAILFEVLKNYHIRIANPCVEIQCRFFMRSFPSSWGVYKKNLVPSWHGVYWELSSFIKWRNLWYDYYFFFKATLDSVMFSQQEDWQMTNWISPLLFTAFHKCWIISIGWIVFRLLSSSSGKMPGIDNCTWYTQRFIISSVIFNINIIGQSSSCWSWLSLGQFLLPCQYLQSTPFNSHNLMGPGRGAGSTKHPVYADPVCPDLTPRCSEKELLPSNPGWQRTSLWAGMMALAP